MIVPFDWLDSSTSVGVNGSTRTSDVTRSYNCKQGKPKLYGRYNGGVDLEGRYKADIWSEQYVENEHEGENKNRMRDY